MTDDDDDEGEAAKDAMDGALAKLREAGEEMVDRLQDLNSLFPATRAFLERCGVSHVKELTPAQRTELKDYLEAERAALEAAAKPLN